jgi:phage baseplate assembly protein W
MTVATYPDYPLHIDGAGHTATTDYDDHVRDLVEQLLFTAPGERVNRPTFGTGLLQLVFLPNSEPLAAATKAAVQGAVTQWLGDVIAVQDVAVDAADSVLTVTVRYLIVRTQQTRDVTLTRATP